MFCLDNYVGRMRAVSFRWSDFVEFVMFRVTYIYIYSGGIVWMSCFGGPQALPGGAKPDPHPLYGGKGLRV
jgi:hypothetical protein